METPPVTRIARRRVAALAAAALASAGASAQSVRSGEVTVHYAAIPASTLDAGVARSLGIVRSPQRVVLNVAVRTGEPGRERSLPAQVLVQVHPPAGRSQAPRMRAVRDGEGLYYLGETHLESDARLRFEIEVRVEGRVTPIRAVFARDFFVGPAR
jgi:hypothetical protein